MVRLRGHFFLLFPLAKDAATDDDDAHIQHQRKSTVMRKKTMIDCEKAVRPFADRLATRRVLIQAGALNESAQVLRDALPAGVWALIADPVTFQVAGRQMEAALSAAGISLVKRIIEPRVKDQPVIADEDNVRQLADWLQTNRPAAAIAVGAGTINDIVKRASFLRGMPCAVAPTAPSMNGYTSTIAAILADGVKTVQDCHGPAAVIADLDVLAKAPARMIAAGFGDLLSKPVSNADWRLSHDLTGSDYMPEIMTLIEEGNRWVTGIGARLRAAETEAVARLTGALMLSGFSMAVAGTSAPASGGEHLISHYLDMTHYAFGEPADLHGCQVGVGTRVAALIYERLLAFDPRRVDIDARVKRLIPWPEYERELARRFGKLTDAVRPHARDGYPTPAALRARLQALTEGWDRITAPLRAGMRSAAAITRDLQDAGCPTTFGEMQVAPERARRSVTHSKDIRARYTVLHLCWELGMLDAWAEDIFRHEQVLGPPA
jgi:glycerol-1-phosphate dehydrogenase [NAD(P)+]